MAPAHVILWVVTALGYQTIRPHRTAARASALIGPVASGQQFAPNLYQAEACPSRQYRS